MLSLCALAPLALFAPKTPPAPPSFPVPAHQDQASQDSAPASEPAARSLPPASAPGDPAPLLDHGQLSQALLELAASSPLASLEEIGRSRSDRALHALRISDGEQAGRPGILVVANLDGPWAYTSGLALQHARDLIAGHATNPELLQSTVFYILPRVNPDGAEARFASPATEQWSTGYDVDNDRDGRQGEDPPSDVNGDGWITSMRRPAPRGEAEWIADETDELVLRKARPDQGEVGLWRIDAEGRDLDGDDAVAEDAALDAQVNRNFALEFEEHTARAGLYPAQEPESRAIYDFVLAHPELQMVVAYGQHDNLAKTPKSVADNAPARMRIPAAGLRSSDAEHMKVLGERFRELATRTISTDTEWDGTFQHWAYGHRGLWTLCIAPWELPLDAPESAADATEASTEESSEVESGAADETEVDTAETAEGPQTEEPKPEAEKTKKAKPSDDAKRRRWIEQTEGEAWRYHAWKPFEHPELGPVEIGGFAPYADIEPPAETRVQLAAEYLAFLQELPEQLARVRFDQVTIEDMGQGLLSIEARLANDGRLPLFTRAGELTRSTRPARVRLQVPEGAQVLVGNSQQLVRQIPGLDSSASMRWLVQGCPVDQIRLTVDTDHAGSDTYPAR